MYLKYKNLMFIKTEGYIVTKGFNEFNENFKRAIRMYQVPSELTKTIKEAQERFKSISNIAASLNFENSITSVTTEFTNLNKQIQSNLYQIHNQNMSAVLVISETLREYNRTITNFRQAVNQFEHYKFSDILRARLKPYEEILTNYEPNLWCLHPELVELLIDKQEEYDIEQVVEDFLENYMSFFMENELFEHHRLIINQAYAAFKNEQYALACFPLFAVIDNLISTQFKDYAINLEEKPKLRNYKDKDYYKFKDFVDSNEDRYAFNSIFVKSIFNIYSVLFKPIYKRHPLHLNRHWVLHGSYDYDRIQKSDVLKLFQLVRATEVMNHVSFIPIKKAE